MVVKTSVRPLDLTQLETLLQQRLQEKLGEISPLQVSCFLKKDALLMAVQHPLPALTHPKRAFRLIEAVFREQNLQWRYRGLMCLKVQGGDRPYAFTPCTEEAPKNDIATQVKASTPEGIAESERVFPSVREEAIVREESIVREGAIGNRQQAIGNREEEFVDYPDEEMTHPDLDFDFVGVDEEEDPNDWMQQSYTKTAEPSPHLEKIWVGVVGTGVVLAIAVFFATLYGLTRPCVLGGCETMEVAEELANNALKTLQDPPSGRAILQAQQQMQQSIALLESIPSWSGKHGEAANLLVAYQDTKDGLKDLISALQIASRAAELSQNPPLPASQWAAAKQTWEEAIAGLETISPNSEFYRFARKKIGEYRSNLDIVSKRWETEQKALESLEAAKEAVKIAEVRQGIAQSLEDLRLADSTWKTAIARLESVSEDSLSYDSTQTELAAILPKAKESEDRKNHELFATEAYNQAVQFAEKARSAQRRNRWTDAVSHWQSAVNYIKQVPSDTFSYGKAQSLIKDYNSSLTRAEGSLKESIQVRQARLDLDAICNGELIFCVYSINNALISVRLTPSYIERVRKTAIAAREDNDIDAQADIMDHIFSLEQALEKVSDNAGIPLEIYTTDNVKVKTHKPR
ncbi:hypothetical protein [Spirulina sp. 06S082]|uniref:hypothetical protein n=1 Tax=Spirulina sp. 06S082 TaxID=3110248 RepID=UPI002B1E9161|nr:hypothetical protein [Spirulina sp. 06S082]MEA5467687.1 hypothetical protein [Spirulina sp. 06S082]